MGFDRDRLPAPTDYFESQGLLLRGREKWKTTRCNFHGGSDSMRVNTGSGAWVCMACGSKGGDVLAYEMQSTGTEFVDAAKALGAWVDDGKPHPINRKATSLPPRAALEALAFETLIVAIEAGRMLAGHIPETARLMVAAGRIQALAAEYQ